MNTKGKNIKWIWITACLFFVCLFTGCGYSFQELEDIQRYQRQGQKNAEAYIEEKYGFKAKVVDVCCEYLVGDIDFSPPPSGDVFVSMEYKGRNFVVEIPGDEKTTTGKDNYQYEEIRLAMELALYDITGVPAEDVFLFYGYYWDFVDVNIGRNGLIPMYFDGSNLAEVLEGYDPVVWAAYVDRDLAAVDMDALGELPDVDYCQLVNYSSGEYYSLLKERYNGAYTIASVEVAEENLPYVKSYYALDYDEERYVEPYLTQKDGILVYTEHGEDRVSLEKEVKTREQEHIEQLNRLYGLGEQAANEEIILLDTYILRSDAKYVYIYVPVELWADVDMELRELAWRFQSHGQELHEIWDYTGDGKYIQTKLYLLDRDYVTFEVVAKEK